MLQGLDPDPLCLLKNGVDNAVSACEKLSQLLLDRPGVRLALQITLYFINNTSSFLNILRYRYPR